MRRPRTVVRWLVGAVVLPAAVTVWAQTVRLVSQTANDLAYDANSGKIDASVPDSGTSNPNPVVPIDPATGLIGTPIPVGVNPNKLAISGDGHYLY